MCTAYTKSANLVAYDEQQWKGIMDWIEFLTTKSTTLKSSNVGSQCLEAEKLVSGLVLDLKYSKHKGAPKKLRQKHDLESCSKK